MVQGLVNGFTRSALWLRRNQHLRLADAPVKVNLGSGLEVAPGWINLDGSLHALVARWPVPLLRLAHRFTESRDRYSLDEYVRILRSNQFIHHDLRYPLPFPTCSVDFMIAPHVMIHLSREEAHRLFREAHRVMRPGAVLRVATTDLEWVLRMYFNGKKGKALEYIYGEESNYLHRRHWFYDFDLLHEALEKAGFSDIERRNYLEGALPDLEILDSRPDESLIVEAIR